MVIAAITSCTNTSNPGVMLGAGLVAKKAVEKGLKPKPWVKTSLAPGSKVVTDYYRKAGLEQYLEQIGFNLVGYGCTTCIGNSGPLPDEIADAVTEGQLVVGAVLSGNRNFEGRVHPQVKANYLASPPLVVAYAFAGTLTKDLTTEALGEGSDGQPVYLKDIWPTPQEVDATVRSAVTSEMFKSSYADVFAGDERWAGIRIDASSMTYNWDHASTYVQLPPYFAGMPHEPVGERGRRQGCPRAGAARRQHHHRPHLARRQHRQDQPGRQVPQRAGGRASRTTTPTAPAAAATK